jgi:hypothetical protein
MTREPVLPPDFDENPPLDDDFFRRAKPALGPGSSEARLLLRSAEDEARRLRRALERIVAAKAEGRPTDQPIEDAVSILADK